MTLRTPTPIRLAAPIAIAALLCGAASAADDNPGPRDGRGWRIELFGARAFDGGDDSHVGDLYTVASVGYEWPIFARAVLGLKAYPLFLYRERADESGDSDLFYGAGFGAHLRYHFTRDDYRGLYAELGIGPIFHAGQIQGNSANLDFLSELGVGYAFENDWHIVVKLQHLSNARIGKRNAGVNALGIGFGRSF